MSYQDNQFVGREDLLQIAGVDVKNLGFVGLKFDPLAVQEELSHDSESGVAILPSDYVYASDGDYRTWVAGPVGETGAHVTAKYGLLHPAHEMMDVVNELVGWPRDLTATVTDIEVFPSPYDDLKYGCLVARLGGDDLLEINAALSTLPHVDSFVEYKPHVTLAYLKPVIARHAGIPEAMRWLLGKKLTVTGIDYGTVR